MNNITIKRIINDIVDFDKNKPENIFINYNKKNIFNLTFLIIGPKNTSYENGYYFFELKFPKDYPVTSPIVSLKTINNKIRFNPNLYENGKVCLSILGTWSGPGWTPVMTLRSVLLSVESLFCEYPIKNEPGYENTKSDNIMSIDYNKYIIYHNYNFAILEVINSFIKKNKYKEFFDIIMNHFTNNYKNILENLESYSLIHPEYKINKTRIYFLSNSESLDFIKLLNNFKQIENPLKSKILKEVSVN